MQEKDRIDSIADWYLDGQLEIDKQLISMRFRAIRNYFKVGPALELGSAEGVMTRLLVDCFDDLTVVEGSKALLAEVPDYPNVAKVNSLFEEFRPTKKFNTIIMEHILEHVDTPAELLHRVSGWLAEDGRLIVGVPNGNSLHRLAAVKMGMLSHPCELNERDHAIGHRRVYVKQTLVEEIEKSRLSVEHVGGVFIKPLSNSQIETTWTREMIEGFYQLGKDLPELTAEIFAVCGKG